MKGVDVAFSRVSPTWARHRRDEGYEIAVVDLWTGGYENNPALRKNSEWNLRTFREAGYITCGYINANPWFLPAESIAQAKMNAGTEWSRLAWLFVDVEIDGTNEGHVRQLCESLKAEGKPIAIYSAQWFWVGHMGNPTDPYFKQYPLWNAYYDGDPDYDFAKAPYGPWTEDDLIGEQFGGTTLEGVDYDDNNFTARYFVAQPEGVPEIDKEDDMTPEESARLSRVEKDLADIHQYLFDPSWNPPNEQPGTNHASQISALLDAPGGVNVDTLAEAIVDKIKERLNE